MSGRTQPDSGSAVVFALFACLVALVSVQVVTATVVLGQRALGEEADGLARLAATDRCLETLRRAAAESWGSSAWTDQEDDEIDMVGRLVDLEGSRGWVLGAEARHACDPSLGTTSAVVERGRDGLDLPMAALVAGRVRASSQRAEPWLVSGCCDDNGGAESCEEGDPGCNRGAVGHAGIVDGEAQVGDGCVVEVLSHAWDLGNGWRSHFGDGQVWGEQVFVVRGARGIAIRPPDDAALGSRDLPALVVALGGCDLDARGLGEVWAVLVADQGSVLLEGTVVHGAVYATETVDLGVYGQIVFEEEVCLWARDRSFTRVRLVPGSRWEGTD